MKNEERKMRTMEKDIEKISGSKRIMAAMMVMTYVFALSPVTVFADSRNEIKVPEVKVEVTEEKSEVLISAENGGSVFEIVLPYRVASDIQPE